MVKVLIMDRQTTADGSISLDFRFRKSEYLKELTEYYDGLVPMASLTDPNDPNWQKKYAHTLPPLACYRFVPPCKDLVNHSTSDDVRRLHSGWENLTQFEVDQIKALKKHLVSKKIEMPEDFDDREILKFL